MSNFKISIKTYGGYVLLTNFSESKIHSPYATFDESIVFGENSQATLKFSIASYITGSKNSFYKNKKELLSSYQETNQDTLNPFLSLLECGRIIRFDMDNYFKIDFVIIKRTPRKIGKNIIFDIECMDSFRFFMSKRGVGLTYPFDESDIEQIVPQDIKFLAEQLVNSQKSEWWVGLFKD